MLHHLKLLLRLRCRYISEYQLYLARCLFCMNCLFFSNSQDNLSTTSVVVVSSNESARKTACCAEKVPLKGIP